MVAGSPRCTRSVEEAAVEEAAVAAVGRGTDLGIVVARFAGNECWVEAAQRYEADFVVEKNSVVVGIDELLAENGAVSGDFVVAARNGIVRRSVEWRLETGRIRKETWLMPNRIP